MNMNTYILALGISLITQLFIHASIHLGWYFIHSFSYEYLIDKSRYMYMYVYRLIYMFQLCESSIFLLSICDIMYIILYEQRR
jgi:hypothetical protein